MSDFDMTHEDFCGGPLIDPTRLPPPDIQAVVSPLYLKQTTEQERAAAMAQHPSRRGPLIQPVPDLRERFLADDWWEALSPQERVRIHALHTQP